MFQYSVGGEVMTDTIAYGQDCTTTESDIQLCPSIFYVGEVERN